MKKEVKITPNNDQISVNVKTTGLIGVGYHVYLFEKNSNNIIFEYSGTNLHDHDDSRTLPNTAKKNIGRGIWLEALASNLVTDEHLTSISLEVFQNGKSVGVLTDTFTEASKNVSILIKLTE